MRTLVDCGCETKVHPDGSGVEIYYCPLHASAKELLDALEKAQVLVFMAYKTPAWLQECRSEESDEACEQIEAAIRKAKGKS